MISFHASSWSPVLYIYYKDSTECSSEILKRTPKGVPRSCFVGVAPAGDRLRSRYQNRFFNPKGFDEYPLIFVWESPSGISIFFFPGDVRSQ